MCGIGGIKRMGEEPIDREAVNLLLIGLQSRGNDATGVALINPTESGKPGLHVFKKDEPAWSFVSSDAYGTWMDEHFLPETKTIILHTRAATKGNPRENINNHPMYLKRTAVVHNGVIRNDDELFKDMKLERNAETDSDVLRAITDRDGISKLAIRNLAKVHGSVACAVLCEDDPDRLLLVRSGSPLVCAELREFFIWSSEKTPIHAAFRPWVKKFGLDFQESNIPGIGWLSMRDDTAWIFGADGLEWHDECRTCVHYGEPRRQVYTNYDNRQSRWDEEAKTSAAKKAPVTLPVDGGRVASPVRVRCRACKKLNKLLPKHQSKDLTLLTCGSCKKPLAVGTPNVLPAGVL